MQYTFALLALAAASVSAQGVTSVLTPTAAAPAGCATNYASNFEITVVLPPAASKRDLAALEKRQSNACSGDGILVATLKNGQLTDSKGRIGAIVANHQFQFDGPPAQTGSIYTAGWSVCNNGSLALGGSAIFYQCLSGTFYNLYDQSQGAQCQQVLIDVIPCGSSAASSGGAGQKTDGQPTAGSATAVVSQKTDGQPNAGSATKAPAQVTQIGDGQVQAASALPKPVSQYTDGQIQVTASPAPAPAPVSQISDGQVQATKASTAAAKPVTQISDGQVQATKATSVVAAASQPAVTQISDGQVQASKATSAPVAAVTQISDGQVQASKATSTAPAAFTGAAVAMNAGSAQVIVGAAAAVAFAMF